MASVAHHAKLSNYYDLGTIPHSRLMDKKHEISSFDSDEISQNFILVNFAGIKIYLTQSLEHCNMMLSEATTTTFKSHSSYTLVQLHNPWTASFYQSLTYPVFRPYLRKLTLNGSIVAIAAQTDEEPVGLILAEMQPQQKVEILSLVVPSSHRQRGIGSALLKQLEQEVTKQGYLQLSMVYQTGQPCTSIVEHLLQKHHWEPPQPRMLVCKATYPMQSAEWLGRSHLPSSYTIFPWSELTPNDRQSIIQRQLESPWIPDDLFPFNHDYNLEPLNSLGLRYQNEVVGWVLNHRLASDTIRYTCSFVRKDLQKMGRIIPLYNKAIQLQASAKIPYAVWTVPLTHTGMASFVLKRMHPYLVSVEQTKGAIKSLVIRN